MATFKEAFAKARKEKGAGKTFTWNGKTYTTDRTDDKKEGKAPPARPAKVEAKATAKSGASRSTAGKASAKAQAKEPAKKPDLKAEYGKTARPKISSSPQTKGEKMFYGEKGSGRKIFDIKDSGGISKYEERKRATKMSGAN